MSKELKYSREFKLDALNLLQEGRSISDISKSLGISVNTLCTWRRHYQLPGDEGFQGPGIRLPKNEQQEELRRLKKEVSELKMERDILKKSAQHPLQERSIRCEFIQKHKDIYLIEKMCQILKVSRSTYYYWINRKLSDRFIRRLELGIAIKKVFDWSKGRYGSPRIAKELQMQVIWVSRPLVSRIMKKKNLKSVVVRRFKQTINSEHKYALEENRLNQDFTTTYNQVWV